MGNETSEEEEPEEEEEISYTSPKRSAPTQRPPRYTSAETIQRQQPSPPPFKETPREVAAPVTAAVTQATETVKEQYNKSDILLPGQPTENPANQPVDFIPAYRRPVSIPPMDTGSRRQRAQVEGDSVPISYREGHQYALVAGPDNASDPSDMEFVSLLQAPVKTTGKPTYKQMPLDHIQIFKEKPTHAGWNTYPARTSPVKGFRTNSQAYTYRFMNGYPQTSFQTNSYPMSSYKTVNYDVFGFEPPMADVPMINAAPVMRKRRHLPSDNTYHQPRKWSFASQWF